MAFTSGEPYRNCAIDIDRSPYEKNLIVPTVNATLGGGGRGGKTPRQEGESGKMRRYISSECRVYDAGVEPGRGKILTNAMTLWMPRKSSPK